MAASVATYNEDHLAYGSLRRDIRPLRTGSDDKREDGLKSRIKALAGFWERLNDRASVNGLQNVDVKPLELWKPRSGVQREPVHPPPSYQDSISDVPPDYTLTDALAAVCTNVAQFGPSMPGNGPETLDVSSMEGIRMYAKKKAKAAKQAAWAEDDGEKKDEGAAGDGGDGAAAGGGDGGAGAGGDGGDPPGGGDGGGDDNGADEFAFGGKKGKKKKKK